MDRARTRRLFDESPEMLEFEANVLSCEPLVTNGAASSHWMAILDQTAFYPEGGGQPADTGILDSANVLDVQEAAGVIRHELDAPVPRGPVQGQVDGLRRQDHTTQHTAQHLLSAVFQDLFDLPTVSFHLGEEVCTIDLEGSLPDAAVIEEAENLVNRHIRGDLPVRVLWPTDAELAALNLRKPLKVAPGEQVRLIHIEGLDTSGCGGTHVSSLGELGLLKILRVERVKGGLARVSFIAAERALRDYRLKHDILTALSQSFSTNPEGLPAIVEKLRETEKGLRKDLKALNLELLPHRAREFVAAAIPHGKLRLVYREFSGADVGSLQALGGEVVKSGGLAAFFVLETESARTYLLRRSEDVPLPLTVLLRECQEGLPLRGGGQDHAVTAGGPLNPDQHRVFVERVRLALLSDTQTG